MGRAAEMNMRFRTLFAVFGVVLAIAVQAADLPVKNMAFQEWNATQSLPANWKSSSEPGTYSIAKDCDGGREGRCVLRITRSNPEGFAHVGQTIPASAVGGHPVKLSGVIRTRDVTGFAALWVRSDAGGSTVFLDNMKERAPKGTTDWRRFEVMVPVPPNGSQVVFGLLLSGAGTAWFDDLAMDVDSGQKVAEYVPPPVKSEWRSDVASRELSIKSLTSDDFADLQFLKPLLAGKRVVQLGESSHGVAQFNQLKTRLVKFLHQEMGYDVIAFESSLSGCDAADRRIGQAPPIDVMKDCIFPVWHSTETLQLFEYLDQARKAGKRLSLAGFDTQNSSRHGREVVTARLLAMIDDEGLRARVSEAETFLAVGQRRLTDAESTSAIAAYGELEKYFLANESALRAKTARPLDIDFAIQEARSRVSFTRQQTGPQQDAGFLVRDRGMADNLDFLLDKAYPQRKVIVWAHNFHIAKEQMEVAGPRAMGGWVAQRRGREVYTVGLFMGRGTAAENNRRPYEVTPASPEYLEAILASTGKVTSFVDFSKAERKQGAEWIFEPVFARGTGRLVPARTYDAVIYIDSVTPPTYL